MIYRKQTNKQGVMYSQDDQVCPVESFKLCLGKLNPLCDALFQRPKPKWQEKGKRYENKPIGKNTIYQMMPNLSKEAMLSRKYTNHCLRATVATVLSKAGVVRSDIIKVTGHRSEKSLTNYINHQSTESKLNQYFAQAW